VAFVSINRPAFDAQYSAMSSKTTTDSPGDDPRRLAPARNARGQLGDTNPSKRDETRQTGQPSPGYRSMSFAGESRRAVRDVALLAMQKVVGSSPISRLTKALQTAPFLDRERCSSDVEECPRGVHRQWNPPGDIS
jgi:hypothetical protein